MQNTHKIKELKLSEGSILVRRNGYGFDKQCPVDKSWSVLFLSGLNFIENNRLKELFN